MPAGQMRSQLGNQEEVRELDCTCSFLGCILSFSSPLTRTHRWFSHLSWLQILLWDLSAGGEEGGRKPEPSYLGKQAEAAKTADDTVYLWQPRPFPTWLGRDRRRETQTQRMHDYYIWLLFLGNQRLRTTLLVEEERLQTSS